MIKDCVLPEFFIYVMLYKQKENLKKLLNKTDKINSVGLNP